MSNYLRLIISGAQTGVDRGALDAAIELGIPHAGWCPRGRKSEDGRIPDIYNVRETVSSAYLPRTRKNVADADATLVFTVGDLTRGSQFTINTARTMRRPFLHIDLNEGDEPSVYKIVRWIEVSNGLEPVDTLNVAGSRESRFPGIGERVKRVMVQALKRMTPRGTVFYSEPRDGRGERIGPKGFLVVGCQCGPTGRPIHHLALESAHRCSQRVILVERYPE